MLSGSGLAASGPTTWADLGCGDGGFTIALAEVIAPGSMIHAIDRDARALGRIAAHHKKVRIRTHQGDFTKQPWSFTDLDGILMARIHCTTSSLRRPSSTGANFSCGRTTDFSSSSTTPIQRIRGCRIRLVVPHLRRSSSWQGMRRSRCSARAPRRIIARSSTRR